jgi:ureidoglycolate hydrolase
MQHATVHASALTDEDWTPFGWLPVPDTDPRDALHRLWFEWADPNLNIISHAYDEVDHTDRGSVCAVMYRHNTHTQALMPLNVLSVLAVAPARLDFSHRDHVEQIRAFALQPLDCFVISPGTWHWGPFPLGRESVRLLNVQGARYADDNASVNLSMRTGVSVEVVVG